MSPKLLANWKPRQGRSVPVRIPQAARTAIFPGKDQVKSFVKSTASRGVSNKRADADVVALRILSCHGDENTPPCEARGYTSKGGHHFCTDCGCGGAKRARLSSPTSTESTPYFAPGDYLKLHHPYLECPRKRPGFSNHSPE